MKRMKLLVFEGLLGLLVLTSLSYAVDTSWRDFIVPGIVPGPMTDAQVIGSSAVEVNGIITFSAFGYCDAKSLEGAALRLADDGTIEATRTLMYMWFANGGEWMSPTNTATVIWKAPAVGYEGSYTIISVISEGSVTIGRPYGISYSTRTVTVSKQIQVVGPIPVKVVITPENSTIIVGATCTYICQAYNAANNPIPYSSSKYAWGTSTIGTLSVYVGTTTILTLGTKSVGVGSITVNILGTPIQGYATITGTPESPSYAQIIPGTANIGVNEIKTFTLEVADKYLNLIYGIKGTWSVEPIGSGSVNPLFGTETIFTAGNEAGTVNLMVKIPGIETSATITLFVKVTKVPSKIVFTPGTVTGKVTGSATISWKILDQYYEPYDGTCTITLTGIVATLTMIGTDSAKMDFGTKSEIGTLTATTTLGTITVSEVATVTILAGKFSTSTLKIIPRIQELHVGTYSSGGGGTITRILMTISPPSDEYGNLIYRHGEWKVWTSLPIATGGSNGTTMPDVSNKLPVSTGKDPIIFWTEINPKDNCEGLIPFRVLFDHPSGS